MTNREFFLKRWEQEYPTFLKVFRALPKDKPDYRPHPRSRSATELVWHIAYEEQVCSELIDTGTIYLEEPPPLATLAETITAYENAHSELRKRLVPLTDRDWEKKGKVIFREKEYPLVWGDFLWYLFFGAIHHRGQLSTYIRPMGGKVPSIYGPSADETLS